MKYLAISFIRIYQWCIAPFLGQNCRFYPSCSHYSVEAMHRHGFLKGFWLSTKRIFKCGPWHPGGHDPVP